MPVGQNLRFRIAKALRLAGADFAPAAECRFLRSRVSSLDKQVTELQCRLLHGDCIDRHYLELVRPLLPWRFGADLVNVGSSGDGGYRIPGAYADRHPWICIGLAQNVDFENELLARGCRVHGFDPTLSERPRALDRRIPWVKLGWGNSSTGMADLEKLVAEASLEPAADWSLKFDIEGHEWDVLHQITALPVPPSAITCELHHLRWWPDPEINARKLQCIRGLTDRYAPVFLNGNNYSANMLSRHATIHEVVELTLVERTSHARSLAQHPPAPDIEVIIPNRKNNPNGKQTYTRFTP